MNARRNRGREVAAFIDYYETPTCRSPRNSPGLADWRYSLDVSDGPRGRAPYFAVFEAEFADIDAFRHAMGSAEGQTVAADVPNYAKGGAVVLDDAVLAGGASK